MSPHHNALSDKGRREELWKKRQNELNHWTDKYLAGITHLRVDGEPGHHTSSRIMAVKFYLGYGSKRDADWTEEFVRRLRHPRNPDYFPEGMEQVGIDRRKDQKRKHRRNQAISYIAPGVTRFDGVPVAAWMVPILQEARRRGWKGRLVSGWRSPSYSTHLCYVMCGAPWCSGRCAGASSNHSGSSRPRGAVDVTYYVDFGRIMREMGNPLHNSLGSRDPVHFSATGN